MLIKILQIIHRYPLATMEQIQEELSVSAEMLNSMVADLVKKGYLKSYESCASACDHCSLSSACGGQSHPKIWMLTDKGNDLARRQKTSLVR